MNFTLLHTDSSTKARVGVLETAHSTIETPCFMPVGTLGDVKGLTSRDLWETGTRLHLANAYHLYLRPGTEIVRDAGGLHKFANWQGSILTDSGGYQIFSLAELRKMNDDGVTFKSHIDGSLHTFTPEKVVEIERDLGPDMYIPLDECPPSNAERHVVEQAVERTIRWAGRAMEHNEKTKPLHGYDQAQFLIVQGGVHRDLRESCAEKLVAMNAPGYAIGGLAVGEPNEVMYQVTDWTTDILPKDKPRYLMGVGTPVDLVECIAKGIDMFDCVLPSRNARNGQLFTRSGKVNIKNSKHKHDHTPIDPETNSYASQNFTKSYLHHLYNSAEITGLILATMHNVTFYEEIVKEAREKILAGEFDEWKREFVRKYTNNA